MHELAAEGMTIVEDLAKKREPLPDVEAVYLITPTENSIRLLMNDFRLGMHMYRCAHIFFTESKYSNSHWFRNNNTASAACYYFLLLIHRYDYRLIILSHPCYFFVFAIHTVCMSV